MNNDDFGRLGTSRIYHFCDSLCSFRKKVFVKLIAIAWKKCLLSSFLVARNFVTNRFVIFEWTIALIIRFSFICHDVCLLLLFVFRIGRIQQTPLAYGRTCTNAMMNWTWKVPLRNSPCTHSRQPKGITLRVCLSLSKFTERRSYQWGTASNVCLIGSLMTIKIMFIFDRCHSIHVLHFKL